MSLVTSPKNVPNQSETVGIASRVEVKTMGPVIALTGMESPTVLVARVGLLLRLQQHLIKPKIAARVAAIDGAWALGLGALAMIKGPRV